MWSKSWWGRNLYFGLKEYIVNSTLRWDSLVPRRPVQKPLMIWCCPLPSRFRVSFFIWSVSACYLQCVKMYRSFQARIIFRQNRCMPCNEWLWETCAPPCPFPACHLNLASQSRESHLNKFAQAGRRQYWRLQNNTWCVECVTHYNSYMYLQESEKTLLCCLNWS